MSTVIDVSAINAKTKNSSIVVRVLRLWHQKDAAGKEGIEMILIDKAGCKIQASIPTGVKNKFMPLLKEGEIFAFQNFQVLENNPKIQNAKVRHQWKIGFRFASKVCEPTEYWKIDVNGFDFVPFGDLYKHDKQFVLDIIGEVKSETITIVSLERACKCDVILADADGRKITCALWDSFADQLKAFMEKRDNADKEPVIVVLQFVMISTFRGVDISTMKHATKLFIRPEIEEVRTFIARRGASGISNSQTLTDNSTSIREMNNDEWLNSASMRTIGQIINSDELGKYICKGHIKDFPAEDSWYYEACGNLNSRCLKGVPRGGKIGDYCKKCKGPIGSITIRYKLRVVVEDANDEACFTFFEDSAFYFLKKSASQVMKEVEEKSGDRDEMPELFGTMLGRECLFKIEASVRFGERVYTVKSVTEDAHVMSQFTTISPNDEVVSNFKDSAKSIESAAKEEDIIHIHEETNSTSTSTQITPLKRGRHTHSPGSDQDDADIQFSSTKSLKK